MQADICGHNSHGNAQPAEAHRLFGRRHVLAPLLAYRVQDRGHHLLFPALPSFLPHLRFALCFFSSSSRIAILRTLSTLVEALRLFKEAAQGARYESAGQSRRHASGRIGWEIVVARARIWRPDVDEMAAPMVVRVMVPSSGRKQNSELMNDAAVLLDPDASADEVRASLRRMQALVKTPKFVQGGSKAATPIVKAVLGIVRARGGPSDEAVLLGVLDTFTSLCKAVKGAAIIVRLENGLPNITSLIAMHIKRVSVQRAGFACLAALAASPQNAIAIAKAGAVQAVLMVLNDKETKYFGVDSMDAASLGLQLLSALIKATEATLPLLGTQLIMQAVVNAIYARVGNRKVVTAATEVLYLVVKRYNSEDVSEASMLRYTDKVKEVGGVDAMLVVIGRYSDCAELFKLAYSVLNRLQRTVCLCPCLFVVVCVPCLSYISLTSPTPAAPCASPTSPAPPCIPYHSIAPASPEWLLVINIISQSSESLTSCRF